MSVRLGLAIWLLAAAGGCNLVFSAGEPDARVETDAATKDAGLGPDAQRGVPNYIGPGDFDGDGMLNDVDPCPADDAELPGANVDNDGDGLPNVCDPQPEISDNSNDCLVFFDGFTNRNAVGLDPRWINDIGGTLAINSNTLNFNSNVTGRGFAHFELDVAADYVRSDAAVAVGVSGPTSFIFAGLAASFESGDVDTFFGGAYASSPTGALQAAAVRTGTTLQASPSSCTPSVAFASNGRLSVELLSGKFHVQSRHCSHSEPTGLSGHKIAIGLARSSIALSYISGTRKLAPGNFCEHSNRMF
jgi:hypothetical protein